MVNYFSISQHLADFLNNQTNDAPQMFAPITTQQQRQPEYVTVTLPVVTFSNTAPDMNSELEFYPHIYFRAEVYFLWHVYNVQLTLGLRNNKPSNLQCPGYIL
jgi:hypothetical protein